MTIDDRLGMRGSTDPRIGTMAAAWAGTLGRLAPPGERRENENA